MAYSSDFFPIKLEKNYCLTSLVYSDMYIKLLLCPRFFSSQSQITQPDENEDEVTEIDNEITEIKEDEDDVIEVISGVGTAPGSAGLKSQTNSQVYKVFISM